jgi:hypothetical protein
LPFYSGRVKLYAHCLNLPANQALIVITNNGASAHAVTVTMMAQDD